MNQKLKLPADSPLRVEYLETSEVGVQNIYRGIDDAFVDFFRPANGNQMGRDMVKTLGCIKFRREHLLAAPERIVRILWFASPLWHGPLPLRFHEALDLTTSI